MNSGEIEKHQAGFAFRTREDTRRGSNATLCVVSFLKFEYTMREEFRFLILR